VARRIAPQAVPTIAAGGLTAGLGALAAFNRPPYSTGSICGGSAHRAATGRRAAPVVRPGGAALAALPPAERALRATEAAAWTGQQAAEVGLRAVAD